MYIGRFLIVAPDWAGYRVSSRSFPHRKVIDRDGTLTVVPTTAASPTDNPYVSYNCLRRGGDAVVIANGTHVDPIAEKLDLGYPVRDALAHGLLTLDFEKDDYDTPRIAGVLGSRPYVGIVRRDALFVQEITEPTIVATYELDTPERYELTVEDAEDVAGQLYNLDFEHPVCAVGVTQDEDGFETAIHNG